MIRDMILLVLGALGICASTFELVKTWRTGSARLRGGRRVLRTRNSGLYWTNFAALCVLLVLSLGLVYVARSGMMGHIDRAEQIP